MPPNNCLNKNYPRGQLLPVLKEVCISIFVSGSRTIVHEENCPQIIASTKIVPEDNCSPSDFPWDNCVPDNCPEDNCFREKFLSEKFSHPYIIAHQTISTNKNFSTRRFPPKTIVPNQETFEEEVLQMN